MNCIIELKSGWKITGYGTDGNIVGPFDGTVPGVVHTDLLRHGLIKDPFWRDQVLNSQWVEAFSWVYEMEFIWPEYGDCKNAELVFEGLDTLADVYLNGSLVGKPQNMFIKHVFNIGDFIKHGKNRLIVKFVPIPEYVSDKDLNKYLSCFSNDRVYIRRMQCTFGWDWVHRSITYGIWRPAYIMSGPDGSIKDVCLRTDRIKGESAALSWEVLVDNKLENTHLVMQLIDSNDLAVWRYTQKIEAEMATGQFVVHNPRLWWPAGYGEQELYKLKATLGSNEGGIYDEKVIDFGIRTVDVEQIPDEQGSTFTILVNGRRIFAKGGNWVPPDPFMSAMTRDRYEHLLSLLKQGDMNMLRVWGGGTYELPDFWDLCNRLGIMVSVDFMMACAQYPETEDWFVESMRKEASSAICMLRNHPCIVFWCGDNELAMLNNPEDDYPGKIIGNTVTGPLCKTLDPSREFFPTSPHGGRPFNSQDEGDCHYSTWYRPEYIKNTDMSDYRQKIAEGRGRFLSEYTVPGSPPLSSLLKMMALEDIKDTDGVMWEFRTQDNPYKGFDGFSHYRMLEMSASKLFGNSDSIGMKVKKMEYVQYEFARLEAEHYRRRKYKSSGLLYWMYNDCWPTSGWSLVDYHGYPKAGYFGAKKGFRPVMVSVENCGEEIALWIVNDKPYDLKCSIRVRTARTSGEYLFTEEFVQDVPADSAFPIRVYQKAGIGFLAGKGNVVIQAVLSIIDSDCHHSELHNYTDYTCYFDVLPKDLELSRASLDIQCEPYDDRSGFIRISTDVYARVVTIEDELILQDNYFDLMPKEVKTVFYETKGENRMSGLPRVTCWNHYLYAQ